MATYDAALAEAMERLALAHDGNGRRWHGHLEAALAALFEYLAVEPGLARVWLVEVPSLGAAGVERHERTMKQLAERLAGLRQAREGGARNGQGAVRFEASVGAVQRVVQARLLEGRAEELPELAPDLARVVRGLFTGESQSAFKSTQMWVSSSAVRNSLVSTLGRGIGREAVTQATIGGGSIHEAACCACHGAVRLGSRCARCPDCAYVGHGMLGRAPVRCRVPGARHETGGGLL